MSDNEAVLRSLRDANLELLRECDALRDQLRAEARLRVHAQANARELERVCNELRATLVLFFSAHDKWQRGHGRAAAVQRNSAEVKLRELVAHQKTTPSSPRE